MAKDNTLELTFDQACAILKMDTAERRLTLDYATRLAWDKLLEAASARRRASWAHKDHGRGTTEGGPDGSDCGCRGTYLQLECAQKGCGFCRAAEG